MFSPTMKWEKEVEDKFKIMTSKLPVFHRHMAVESVTVKAERNAKERNSESVQEEDVVSAFFSDVPSPFYSMMVSLLGQSGFDYKKYGYPKT